MHSDQMPEGVLPDPERLLQEAQLERSRKLLESYFPVIRELRSKHFTFRDIAEWLNERGFDVDHNAVYRAYLKFETGEELARAAADDDAIELEDAEIKIERNKK